MRRLKGKHLSAMQLLLHSEVAPAGALVSCECCWREESVHKKRLFLMIVLGFSRETEPRGNMLTLKRLWELAHMAVEAEKSHDLQSVS